MQPIGRQRAAGAASPSPASPSFPAIPCVPACRSRTGRRHRRTDHICVATVLLLVLGTCAVDAETMQPNASSAFETGDPLAIWIAEASRRFERGVDRTGAAIAADRAARLMRDVAGGVVAPLSHGSRALIVAFPFSRGLW